MKVDQYVNRHLRPFLFLWPWPWPDDLNIWTWSILSGNIPAEQNANMNFLRQGFQKLSPDRQTDRQTDSFKIIYHVLRRWLNTHTYRHTIKLWLLDSNISGRKLIEPDQRSERSQKLIWPDRRWQSDLMCGSKLIKSDWRSEKPRQLIQLDWLFLQLPRGHSDRHWLKAYIYSLFYICKALHKLSLIEKLTNIKDLGIRT